MKFVFPSGEHVTRAVGANLAGLMRAGRRPSTVILNRNELLELKRNYSYLTIVAKTLELDNNSILRELTKIKEDPTPALQGQSGDFPGA